MDDGARRQRENPAVFDFARIVTEPTGPSTVGRRWKGFGGVRLRRAIDELIVPAFADHAVLVNIGRPYRLEEKLGGCVFQTFGGKGHVAVVPAGVPLELRTRTRARQEVESFLIHLAPAFVREIAAGADVDPDAIELAGILGGRDATIERIGLALLPEVEGDGLLGELYAESLATALAVHLLRTYTTRGGHTARALERGPAGGLAKAELRRVIDYVEESLRRELTLAEIAGVAHMSAFHFSRMFKRSTGLSPYQYVLRRRVERARDLLVGTVLPLHEVARLAGFADQSRLAKHTRRLLGATPRSLRLLSD